MARNLMNFLTKLGAGKRATVLAAVWLLLLLIEAVLPESSDHHDDGMSSTVTMRKWDYIIVGSGPGGLQLGYFMEKAGRDYIILERSNSSGNFFTTYPRHDKLISINKRYTGKSNKEFNLRHDWNSLISDDEKLLFRHYSKDFFPHRTTFLKYLDDYRKTFNLKVQLNTEVSGVDRVEEGEGENKRVYFTFQDQHGNKYECKTLIMATGIGEPNKPEFEGMELVEGYEDVSVNASDFEGQTVLILGRGNAAFEVADVIYGVTNLIHMIGRSRVRLSWSTHYVGDLRAVNNALLDTYQLKSLDGVLEAPLEDVKLVKRGNKYFVDFSDSDNGKDLQDKFDNFAMREGYDRVIRCLGFRFDMSIFKNESAVSRGKGRKSKYPVISHSYESVDFPGMFVAGGAAHSLDHRKSSGGFIHGLRYTARTLHRLLEWRNHEAAWPYKSYNLDNLMPVILKRINEGSGIYQMFGMLGDVIAMRKDRKQFDLYEEFPINVLPDFTVLTGHEVDELIVIVLEYGANFSGPGNDVFRLDRATGEPSEAHHSNFLHPVFYYYKKLPSWEQFKNKVKWQLLPRPDWMHHIVEDFLTSWDAPMSHVLPLRRFLEIPMGQDIRQYFAEDCFKIAMTHDDVPLQCKTYLDGSSGLLGNKLLLDEANKAHLLL